LYITKINHQLILRQSSIDYVGAVDSLGLINTNLFVFVYTSISVPFMQ